MLTRLLGLLDGEDLMFSEYSVWSMGHHRFGCDGFILPFVTGYEHQLQTT